MNDARKHRLTWAIWAAASVIAGVAIVTLNWTTSIRNYIVEPPIVIPDSSAHWIDSHQFDIVAPSYAWNDTCSAVFVTWLVTTKWGSKIAVFSKAIQGPFGPTDWRPPSYEKSIVEKRWGTTLQLRAKTPEWLMPSDVKQVVVTDTVPESIPCESGWYGVLTVFRLEIAPLAAPSAR